MSETEFIAEIGPFKLQVSDWNLLQKEIDTFCKGNNEDQIFFAITEDENNEQDSTNGLIIFPMKNLNLAGTPLIDSCKLHELVTYLLKIKGLLAFGYVRKEGSIKPNENDYDVSLKIDRAFRKPICYIIMNSNFEYMSYMNPPGLFYRMLQPVDEDENV